VVEAFDVRKPKQLTLTGLQLVKSAAHIRPRLRIILKALIACADRFRKLLSTPSIPQKICRNSEKITPAFCGIHFRQLGSQETAVALLKQIVGNVAASGCPQKISPQRTVRSAVENTKRLAVHIRPIS